MCLGVPAKIISIDPNGLEAIVETWGVRASVSLALVEGCKPGTYVLVHAGHAISVIDEEEAKARLSLWKELANSKERSSL
ncbi:hydrogenase expression/formation protein HypC [Thermanaeromonas toyohensis ToBE]|uniref:Hydrogenase expression/formation protein HypC n=1 Tax=Thermanaeromonas toyohensis ToBE TaxID=698762 RepID=A0A1W1W0K7_9FIRM|nr:HypC/HybG/HupF family hydrogenase formation chaperone [Thermanaeromonas toyohensis]SMB98891.1 hydrogenase expression/formation protein HypC [Thermanaeromonas toyohensis ToBE]